MMRHGETERRRMQIQKVLDDASTQEQRNEMGQFATPPELAIQILRYAAERTTDMERVRFLDPGIGTGAFYSALLSTVPRERIASSHGYEIQPEIAAAAKRLWADEGLNVRREDFTTADPPNHDSRFNLLICNPPYVRHHRIGAARKLQMKQRLESQGHMKLNGLAGLYAYFIGLTHPWMEPGALAGWLIPSEFMDVNYGKGVRDYLTNKVSLIHIHRFDPGESQFSNALVSSAAVWFTNTTPQSGHRVRMTFGGTLDQPATDTYIPLAALRDERKWSHYPEATAAPEPNRVTLADLFNIKRGIATGKNNFFVVSEQEVKRRNLPRWALKPVLPGARKLKTDVVVADQQGLPELDERLFLLDCDLDESTVADRSPELDLYLQEGRNLGVTEQYLPRHRNPWYSQEKRPPAPFLCTYMGRTHREDSNPFRFILNHSEATALNVYLMMYPKTPLARRLEKNQELKIEIWRILKSIRPEDMMREGRVYGGGLRKVEPKELGRVGTQRLTELLIG